MMSGDDLEGRVRSKNSTRTTENYHSSYAESYWTSWLIPVFVVVNIAVFVVLMYVNDCPKHNRSRIYGKCVARFLGRFSFQPLRENPTFGASANSLEKLGALQWRKIVHGNQGWRLVTANWLHAGLIHLVANMLSLVLIGIRLEQQFGFLRVGLIYLLSGFGGSILSSLFVLCTSWSQLVPPVLSRFTRDNALRTHHKLDNLLQQGGSIDNTYHHHWFVLLPRPQFGWLERHNLPADVRVRSKYKVYQYVFGLIALVLLVAGFTMGLVMLFHGENGYKHCHWCRYLNCVPTSKWECNSS
ncbi:unnamed protein product [Lactuca virosa]|uniref:RHOMBOID-like protein n=1 Tax=Lactuca virosa TaxID=75947 RepID=A0AAU9P5T0_9ASTR|nr:unnamed protein product [Lactuca virosa]